MKRYWILGSVIVFIGVVLALVLNANSADDGQLTERKVSAEQLRQWLNNKKDAVYEIRKNEFYVQEAIGSQGVSLTIPQKFYNDFIVRFNLMSVTESANIKLIKVNTANGDTYSFEIRQRPKGYRFSVYHNGHSIVKKDGDTLEPNVFYAITFEKKANQMALTMNNEELWRQDFPEGTGRKAMFNILLLGLPDHPAGIVIKDMVLYTGKK